jgi:hypothetical protein
VDPRTPVSACAFYTVRKTETEVPVEGKIKQRVVLGPDSAELPGVSSGLAR